MNKIRGSTAVDASSDAGPDYLRIPDPETNSGWGRLTLHPELSRNILRLALPVVLGMVTQTAVNILDTVMVGRLPMEIANPGQSAIGFSLPIMWLIGGSLSAIWVGTQAITSRRNGGGEYRRAGEALTNSVALGVISSVVVTALAIPAVEVVMPVLNQDPSSRALGTDYLQIRLLGVAAMVVTFALKSFFDGIGRTHYFMNAAVVMNLLNALLNAVLIYGYPALGIPRLEVRGAAWASVISAYVGLAILGAAALSPSLLRSYRHARLRNLNGRILGEIIRLSLPNAGATAVVMGGFTAFYWVIGRVNDSLAQPGNPIIAAAAQAVVTLNLIGIMTALAFGSATASLVGQAAGARRFYLGERYGWEAAKLWAYVMGVFGAALFVAPDFFVGLVNPDPMVIEAARSPLRVLASIQGLAGAAMVFAQTLYGLGEAKFVMVTELCLHLGVMAPGAYLLGIVFEFGLVGVFLGPAVYISVLAAATFLRFRSGRWKRLTF